MLDNLGIPCLQAVGEAEAMCALLNKQGVSLGFDEGNKCLILLENLSCCLVDCKAICLVAISDGARCYYVDPSYTITTQILQF